VGAADGGRVEAGDVLGARGLAARVPHEPVVRRDPPVGPRGQVRPGHQAGK